MEKKEKKEEKKKSKLNPIAKESKGSLTDSNLKELEDSFINNRNGDIEVIDTSQESTDTFFSNVLDKLFSDKDIDMKTEYPDEETIFASSKATFISKIANVSLIGKFIEQYERKLVSKGRKGRMDIILGLQRRQEEEQAKLMNNNRPYV